VKVKNFNILKAQLINLKPQLIILSHKQEIESQINTKQLKRILMTGFGYTKMKSNKKYRVEKIEMKTYYIVISSLDVLQNQTYSDFLKLLRINGLGN
jgi:predicted transcriptional regulator